MRRHSHPRRSRSSRSACGLGGFSLAYHATLARGAADQAADRVPLDATVAPGADFKTPLALAPLARWRALARGPVLPVRRTEAGYSSGAGVVTISALGSARVRSGPDSRLACQRRLGAARRACRSTPTSGDGSSPGARAPRPRRLAGSERIFGRDRGACHGRPPRSDGSRHRAPARNRHVGAAFAAGADTSRALGARSARAGRADRARDHQRAPERGGPRRHERAAIDRDARSDPGAFSGRPRAVRRPAPRLASHRRGRPGAAGECMRSVTVVFDATGQPGVVRPAQPSDTRPVPVLADPQTVGAAGARRTAWADCRRPADPRAGGRRASSLPNAARRQRRVRRGRCGDSVRGARRATARAGPCRRAVGGDEESSGSSVPRSLDRRLRSWSRRFEPISSAGSSPRRWRAASSAP